MFLIVYLCPLYLKVSFAEYKIFGSLILTYLLFYFLLAKSVSVKKMDGNLILFLLKVTCYFA